VTDRLRVLRVIDSLSPGGAEQLEVTFAQALRPEHGVDLTVVALRRRVAPQLVEALHRAGVNVLVLPEGRNALTRGPLRVLRLVRLLRAGAVDVVATSLTHGNVLGTTAARLAGVPSVATLHCLLEETLRQGARIERLERWALRHGATTVVAVGACVAGSHAARLAPREITVIPNAVGTLPTTSATKARALREELLGDFAGPLLLSVGRLVPAKGLLHLVAAFDQVRRRHPAARLVVAGDGPQRQELEDEIGARGLDGAVRLLGFRTDVPALLSASDVFVSASVSEGSPVAVLEAMAHGLPVVATGVGDVPTVVAPAGGLVVPAGSPDTLAAAIVDVLHAPDAMRAMGRSAASYVAEHHSAEHWADVVVDLYQGLAGVRSASASTLRAGR